MRRRGFIIWCSRCYGCCRRNVGRRLFTYMRAVVVRRVGIGGSRVGRRVNVLFLMILRMLWTYRCMMACLVRRMGVGLLVGGRLLGGRRRVWRICSVSTDGGLPLLRPCLLTLRLLRWISLHCRWLMSGMNGVICVSASLRFIRLVICFMRIRCWRAFGYCRLRLVFRMIFGRRLGNW